MSLLLSLSLFLVAILSLSNSLRISNYQRKVISTDIYTRYTLHSQLYNQKDPVDVDVDETVKKSGLEAGLWQSITSKKSDSKPQELLKKYGVAYLATSISLAIISYSLCYLLVSNGVDVGSLLEKVGIKSTGIAENAGTAGIAYAIHKASSPIRFPPTVALTPVVANLLGKKLSDETV